MNPPSKQQGVIGRIFLVVILLTAIGGVITYYTLYPESMPEWVSKTQVGRDIQTTTVYKWQDAAGAWHVSDQPPPKGTEYQVEKYARDTNVLPPLPERQ